MLNNKNSVASIRGTANNAAIKYIAQANGLNPQDLKDTWIPVVDTENKKIYLTISDAALAANITPANMVKRCNRNSFGFAFAGDTTNKILKECATSAMAIMKGDIGRTSCSGYGYSYKKNTVVTQKKLRIDPVCRFRSATPETAKYQDMDKWNICAQIFASADDIPVDWSKGTIILDNGKVSPVETHFTRPDNNIMKDPVRLALYTKERTAIKKSCANYSRVMCRMSHDGTTPMYNGMRFAYLSELPVDILKGILKEMKEHKCKDYIAYNKYKEKHPTNYTIVLGRISKQKTTYSQAEATMMLNEIARLKKQNKELFDKLGKSIRY